MKTILILSILFSSLSLNAYIPKLRTIVKNISEKRSDRSSLLTRELIFKTNNDKILINEKWYIKDESNILIVAEAPGFKYIAIHKDGKRYRLNSKKQVVSANTDTNFFMPLFLSSDPNFIAKYFVRMGIVNSSILTKPETVFTLDEVKHIPEENIRLSRHNDKITYGIGKPMAKDSNQVTNQVWVIQDLFEIYKLRHSDFIVNAENYSKYRNGFWFPKKILLNWSDYSVEASTLKLEPLTVGPKTKKKFEFSYLQDIKVPEEDLDNPSLVAIKKFYLKFR